MPGSGLAIKGAKMKPLPETEEQPNNNSCECPAPTALGVKAGEKRAEVMRMMEVSSKLGVSPDKQRTVVGVRTPLETMR